MSAVCDTGPLLVLSKLNRLALLPALYNEVLIAKTVYFEAVTVGKRRGYPDAIVLEAFLAQVGWKPVSVGTFAQSLLMQSIGEGEREAIGLALQHSLPLLMDDSTARRIAHTLGLDTKGSLGVLIHAYRSGLLSSGELDQLLTLIEQRDDIWIDPALCQSVRQQVLE